MSPSRNEAKNPKSSYQMMNSDLFVDNRMVDRNNNLKKIQQSNPQILPPAGKNFYDFQNKNMFISAQREGSMNLYTPKREYTSNTS